MGTSLSVAPFCDLVHECPPACPRLLLNLTEVGTRPLSGGLAVPGLRLGGFDNYRSGGGHRLLPPLPLLPLHSCSSAPAA